MAKIFAPPLEVGPAPEYDSTVHYKEMDKREDAWVAQIIEYCRKNGQPLCGEEICFGVCDGRARYIVLSEKPLQLIHLPLGDAYQFEYANRLTLKDIRENVERQHRIRKLFS